MPLIGGPPPNTFQVARPQAQSPFVNPWAGQGRGLTGGRGLTFNPGPATLPGTGRLGPSPLPAPGPDTFQPLANSSKAAPTLPATLPPDQGAPMPMPPAGVGDAGWRPGSVVQSPFAAASGGLLDKTMGDAMSRISPWLGGTMVQGGAAPRPAMPQNAYAQIPR